MLHNLRRNRSFVQIRRIGCGYLHSNIFCISFKLRFGSHFISSIKFYHNADSASSVNIGGNYTLITLKTADLDILADGENLILNQGFYRHIGTVGNSFHQSVHISRILFQNSIGAGLYKVLEIRVLRNKVSLSIYFDHNAYIASLIGSGISNAFCSDTASLLGSGSQTFFSQYIHSGFHVAVSLSQSLFAVHHAATCFFSQICYVFCSKSHRYIPPFLSFL